MKKIFVDPYLKIISHVNFIFGKEVGSVLPKDLEIEHSRKTGRIKNFGLGGNLIGTFRTDGGIALTIYGAKLLLNGSNFIFNCIIPYDDAIPFVSEGRSLFVKHVLQCGKNVKTGSDVAIIDKEHNVLAVGHSLLPFSFYDIQTHDIDRSFMRGVGVKIREGLKSRST